MQSFFIGLATSIIGLNILLKNVKISFTQSKEHPILIQRIPSSFKGFILFTKDREKDPDSIPLFQMTLVGDTGTSVS